MPSSNNTVSRCITDMAGDGLKQLPLRKQASKVCMLQLDESTDLAQFLVYVRYVYGWSIQEDILFCKPQDNRRGYWTALWHQMDFGVKMCWYLYWWRKSHGSIHREALAAKRMPDYLKDVLDTTVKMVNFVKARPLNCCVKSFYKIQKCTGYQGARYWHVFWNWETSLKCFFTDHNFHLSDHLHDEFLTRLAYLGDVFSNLNDLNLGKQGLSATIFNVRDNIEAMIKKLELFSVWINKDNSQVFPSLCDFFCVQINTHVKWWYACHFPIIALQTTRTLYIQIHRTRRAACGC